MSADQQESAADLTTLIGPARAGDRVARDELIRRAQGRLERLTRRMLRKYPGVCRWAEAEDVFQDAAVRLLRSLDGTEVTDSKGFFNLAAMNIRRELIDLARRFQGPHGLGANHASLPPGADPLPAADEPDADDLDRWAALHEAAERLPVAEREVFGLLFYHGWKQEQIGELFGIDERTVRRRFRRAVKALKEAVGGTFPAE